MKWEEIKDKLHKLCTSNNKSELEAFLSSDVTIPEEIINHFYTMQHILVGSDHNKECVELIVQKFISTDPGL